MYVHNNIIAVVIISAYMYNCNNYISNKPPTLSSTGIESPVRDNEDISL